MYGLDLGTYEAYLLKYHIQFASVVSNTPSCREAEIIDSTFTAI